MKEIKAYIRPEKIEEVVHTLEKEGIKVITAIEIKCVGRELNEGSARYSMDYTEKYCPFVKIEIVCGSTDTEKTVELIRRCAWTGHKGDGMIFVSTVDEAVNIRTGARGREGISLW